MNQPIIEPAIAQNYPELLTVWEASVIATHDFLSQQVIAALKPAILNDYLPAVTVFCNKDSQGNIKGFAGIADNRLEMLFIHPNTRGQGLGKALLKYVIRHFHIDSLDVNEQNPQAVGFYLKQGFQIIGRSEQDGQGNPYPLLHLRLSS